MKHMRALLAAAAVSAGLLVAGPALAFPSYSAAHLNIRTGPGPQYPVIATTGFNNLVNVNGCLKDISWCDVVSTTTLPTGSRCLPRPGTRSPSRW
jgi:uncharacterized protein YraI